MFLTFDGILRELVNTFVYICNNYFNSWDHFNFSFFLALAVHKCSICQGF